jgi:putative spermidine/putrescine transport system ATP-binding protein
MARLELENVRLTYPKAARPAVDISLAVDDGELLSLLGPSGCGKTTALRIIGGFLTPQFGRVRIDGVDVTSLEPDRRPTAMVFQQYALWPHMTVWHNVAFGLEQRRLARKEIDRRVTAALGMLGLSDYAGRFPAQLSGGQQQRVALARAIVLEPKILLLDEPLSNLDAHMRERVRDELHQLQRRLGITTVFVTHDQSEAFGLSDRVAVMTDGKIAQLDRPAAIYTAPRTLFVAGFIGTMNLLEGDCLGNSVRIGDSLLPVDQPCHVATRAILAIRPEDVVLGPDGAPGACAEVVGAALRGADTDVYVRGSFGTLRVLLPTEAVPPVGRTVSLRVRRVAAYDRESGCLLVEGAGFEAVR